jgi:hypothetical protein
MSAPEDRDARARRRKINFRKRHHGPAYSEGPSRRARQHDPWCDDYAGESHVDYEEVFQPLNFHDADEGDE